ncbi:unannotated protein [freshwater metagenome]|uniref:Unannotated protein n=1 Tax=freshwater metagenome TaxID=449393 RepID=A0A6J6UI12_9ZZZZ
MNSDGIETPIIVNVLCKLSAKPNNKAANTAPIGLHLPKIRAASAIKPAPAVISLPNAPTEPTV